MVVGGVNWTSVELMLTSGKWNRLNIVVDMFVGQNFTMKNSAGTHPPRTLLLS
jgi:hypothetical protein